MANLTETATYDAGVYQLEIVDPVVGGAAGISNTPLKNLANRTMYLKSRMDLLEAGTTIPPTFAPLASPTLTGDPKAPTPALGDNDTSIATTAFVQATGGGRLVKSVAGAANVTLSAVEAGNGALEFTGVLTGSISVIVPLTPTRSWTVFNNTTGAFTLTVKTAAGTGVLITQGLREPMACDGVNVNSIMTDFKDMPLTGVSTAPTAAPGVNTTQIATTAFVEAARLILVAATALKAPTASPSLTGVPLAPTPAQFDNTTKLATTEFVQRASGALAGLVSYAVNTTLTAADANKFILPNSASAITLTLPVASALPTGTTFNFRNAGVGVCSLLCAGADIFYRAGAVTTTLLLATTDSATLLATPTGWELLTGSAALRAATGDFGASIGGSGYQKLPSGLIIQWNLVNGFAGGVVIPFPITFPTACFAVALGCASATGITYTTSAVGAANFTLTTSNAGPSGSYYIAIGK